MTTPPEELSARVNVVAEKLSLKANEAQQRGNAAAASSLRESVEDLKSASAFLLQHAALSNPQVEELITSLARVDKMLQKKSEEMKQKGNENAAQALQQAAASVARGSQWIRAHSAEKIAAKGTLEAQWSELQEILDDKNVLERLRVLRELEANVKSMFPSANVHECWSHVKNLKQALEEERLKALEDAEIHRNELAQSTKAFETLQVAHKQEQVQWNQRILQQQDEYEKQLRSKEEELEALSTNAATWKQQLHVQTELVTELQQLMDQEKQQVVRLEAMRCELDVANGKLQELCQSYEENKQEQQEDACDEWQRRCDQLETDRKQLEDQLHKTEHDYAACKTQYEKERAEWSKATDELKEALAQKLEAITIQQATIETLKQHTEATKEQLTTLSSVLETNESDKIVVELQSLQETDGPLRQVATQWLEREADVKVQKHQWAALHQSIDAFVASCRPLLPKDHHPAETDVSKALGGIQNHLQALSRRVEDQTALQDQLTALRDEKEALELHLQAQGNKRHEMETKDQELQQMQQRLKDLQTEFDRYRTRSHAALRKVEKRAELLNGMKKENDQLKLQVDAKATEYATALANANAAEAARKELEHAHHMLMEETTNRLEMQQEKLSALKTALEQFKTQHEAVETQRKQSEQERVRLENEKLELATAQELVLREKDEQIQVLKTQLEHQAEEIQQWRAKLVELEKEVKTRQQTITALEAQLKTQSSEVAMAKWKAMEGEQQEEIEKLTTALTTCATERKRLEERIQQLEADVQATQSAHEAQVETMRNEVERAKADNTALQQTMEKKTHEMTALQGERMALEEQADPTELVAVKEKVAELTTQLSTAETKAAELQTRVAALEQENGAKDAQIMRLLNEINALSTPKPADEAPPVDLEKERLIQDLRKQVLTLQEEADAKRQQQEAMALENEANELKQLQATRQQTQQKREREYKKQQLESIVATFNKQVHDVVQELQQILEEHAAAFRQACAVREQSEQPDKYQQEEEDAVTTDPAEFEEYLVLNSGVVIKAGATFSLPVICDHAGWRVVWKFRVQEDGADVGFALMNDTNHQTIVLPQRVHELHGTIPIDEAARLVFEWDNTFSWLTEKTLDYHVSVQEPLSLAKKQQRARIQTLSSRCASMADMLSQLDTEAQLRTRLEHILSKLAACERDKDVHLQRFRARQEEITREKTELQQQMEAIKADLSATLAEQDAIEDDMKHIIKTWEMAESDRQDASTTIQLAISNNLSTVQQWLTEQLAQTHEELTQLTGK